jgi:hypothetical protein
MRHIVNLLLQLTAQIQKEHLLFQSKRSKLKHQPGEPGHIIVPCFLHLMFIYKHVVTSTDTSHTKRTLTLPTEKEQTQNQMLHLHPPMIQNDKKQCKTNRYYIAVFTKPFTYKCFTYNHSGETIGDESQQTKNPDNNRLFVKT